MITASSSFFYGKAHLFREVRFFVSFEIGVIDSELCDKNHSSLTTHHSSNSMEFLIETLKNASLHIHAVWLAIAYIIFAP